jgi:hypothetical protein
LIPPQVFPLLIAPSLAATVRAAADAHFSRYDFAPKGRYDRIEHAPHPGLDEPLVTLAQNAFGEPFTVGDARFVRLGHRDYSLLWDDATARFSERFVEAVIDLSDGETGEAEIHYCAGDRPFFVAPQLPGSVILVERMPGVLRWQRYLGHRVGAKKVYRLFVELRPRSA